MRASLPLLLWIAACTQPPSPNGNQAATGTTGSTITSPQLPGTTAPPQGTGYGSLMLVRKANQKDRPPTVELAAIFPTNDPGFKNLAQCAIVDGPCLPQLPTVEDDYIEIDPDRAFDATQYDYAFAGTDVGFGPLRAWYQNAQIPHYYADLTEDYDVEGFDGTYGVKVGGEWGDYLGWDDIVVSPAMNVMSHFAGQNIGFHDGQKVVIEWEPRGEGEVYLSLHGGATLNRMYLLEDDGYFELDADSLGLGYDELEMKISLQRWNHSRVDVHGNELDVVSVSEVAWNGTYFYVGGRDELIAADTCGDTNTMDTYGTGQYWGRLADWGYADNLDLGWNGSCTGWFSTGEEGFVKFELPPLTFLTITLELLDDDASLYLVTDCNDADTCLTGSDEPNQGVPETVQYFNGGDDTQVVYAVFDGYTSTNGLFYADISVNTMGPPDMHDTCAAATGQVVPTGAGAYYSDVTAYTNQLDPVGTCIANSNPGPDAMTRVDLQPGETITVNVDMAGSDPGLYLVYNCSNPSSCAAGSDIDVGPTESLQYTNTSTQPETLYLVVDSKVAINPYFMTIDIQ